MTIREHYLKEYPDDELGFEINPEATFVGLLDVLHNSQDVYDYIGEHDSIIRERSFLELSRILNKPYNYVWKLWLNI